MSHLITLFLILMPMFIGFALPKSPYLAQKSETLLGGLVVVILLVIGIELGLVDDLWQRLGNIVLYLSTLSVLTLGMGLLALYGVDGKKQRTPNKTAKTISFDYGTLKSSAIQIACLVAGFALATFLPTQYLPPKNTTLVLLIILLFFVGISLKNANIPLKHVLLNRQGLLISVVFMVATLAGGLIFSLMFDEVSWQKGLALASGFGWYSLSGSVMTDAYGAVWGSVALLNDLFREIIALIFIPYVMRHSPSAAIGLGGVTSLDFTLPTLQKAGGNELLPTIISFGFITNVVSPVLMVLFSSLG